MQAKRQRAGHYQAIVCGIAFACGEDENRTIVHVLRLQSDKKYLAYLLNGEEHELLSLQVLFPHAEYVERESKLRMLIGDRKPRLG